jgi:hypothetical protein
VSLGWWWLTNTPDGEVVACAPNKCGLTSFQIGFVPGLNDVVKLSGKVDSGKAAFSFAKGAGLGPFTGVEVTMQFPNLPKLMAVREPEGRFISIWRHVCSTSLVDHLEFKQTAGMSPDKFMSYIETFPMGNVHWAPQWAFLIPGAKLIPFDQFNEALGLPAVHANSHAHRGSPDLTELHERIKFHFSQDFLLWSTVAK